MRGFKLTLKEVAGKRRICTCIDLFNRGLSLFYISVKISLCIQNINIKDATNEIEQPHKTISKTVDEFTMPPFVFLIFNNLSLVIQYHKIAIKTNY